MKFAQLTRAVAKATRADHAPALTYAKALRNALPRGIPAKGRGTGGADLLPRHAAALLVTMPLADRAAEAAQLWSVYSQLDGWFPDVKTPLFFFSPRQSKRLNDLRQGLAPIGDTIKAEWFAAKFEDAFDNMIRAEMDTGNLSLFIARHRHNNIFMNVARAGIPEIHFLFRDCTDTTISDFEVRFGGPGYSFTNTEMYRGNEVSEANHTYRNEVLTDLAKAFKNPSSFCGDEEGDDE